MKKVFIFSVMLSALIAFSSCGSKKIAADSYYDNPRAQTSQPTRKARESSRIEKAALDCSNGRLRAFGSSKDYELEDARKDAIRNAQVELAELLERAILETTTDFRKKATVQNKKFSEKEIEDLVETEVVAIVKKARVIDTQAYDVSDGTIEYEVCVEIPISTDEILEQTGENLSRDGVLGIDYDKQKYIEENKQRIDDERKRLYEKIK